MLDFVNNQSWNKSTGIVVTASSLLTVVNSTGGYVNDVSGNWSLIGANTARRSNLGLLVEEARTNGIRNNSMQGAVAGSPGTAPNFWSGTGIINGVTFAIVGTGTENGIDYIDLSITGTPSITFQQSYAMEATTAIGVLAGQTWMFSSFLRVLSGSFTGFAGNVFQTAYFTSGLVFCGNRTTPIAVGSSTLGASSQTMPGTINQSVGNAAASSQPLLTFNFTNGVAVAIVMRIGWPQYENNNIAAVAASGTKQVAGATYVNGATTFTVAGGTGTAAVFNVTIATNGLSTVDSVNNAGSYTTPPTPNASGFYTGTVASGNGDGTASISIAWTDNSAKAWATSPIRTTAAAATRAADVVSLITPPAFGSAWSMFTRATPQVPDTSSTSQFALELSDGSATNRSFQYRFQNQASLQSNATGVLENIVSTPMAVGVSSKFAAARAASDQALVLNGAAPVTAANASVPVGLNTVRFGGSVAGGSLYLNGFLPLSGIWLTQRVPNAQLQSMTT